MKLNIIPFVFLLLCLFSANSCEKQPDFRIQNPDNRILIMGHGGMGEADSYPMNSYESLMSCLHWGADGTEIDVQMTSDGVLVAFHDEQIHAATQGSGRVIDHTWQELRRVRYRVPPYMEYNIASLDTLFQHIPELDRYYFSFDCKLFFDEAHYPAFVSALIALLEKYGLQQQVFIESGSLAFFTRFQLLRHYACLYKTGNFDQAISIADSLDLYGIVMNEEQISEALIREAHDLGLYVHIWGPASKKEQLRAVRKNPDAIQTNNVPALLNLLK